MTVDLIIKNCKIVYPFATIQGNIAIDGEKIAGIGSEANLPQANKSIDAEGRYVIPGAIDPHVHTAFGPYEKDCITETQSAASGGITTAMFMTWSNMPSGGPPATSDSLLNFFPGGKEIAEKNSSIDFCLHGMLYGKDQAEEIPDYVRKLGMTSFKLMMVFRGEEAEIRKRPPYDDSNLYIALENAAKIGYPARVFVHAEHEEIYTLFRKKLQQDGRNDFPAWSESRPNFCEWLEIERAVSFAKILNAPLYVVHVSTREGVEIISKAQSQGTDVVAETCPHYLTLTNKDFPSDFILGKVQPPLREKEDCEKLWWGIQKGIIKTIGSDHCAFVKENKGKSDIWSATPGLPGVGTLLPVMLSEGVNKGRISLEKLVEVCCRNPAKILGLSPRKGILFTGSDADLVILDMDKTVKVTPELLHSSSDFTLYDGWELKGWPVLTMVRGNIIMENGEIVGKPGTGRYIPRGVL
jgi:D-hydantoinase